MMEMHDEFGKVVFRAGQFAMPPPPFSLFLAVGLALHPIAQFSLNAENEVKIPEGYVPLYRDKIFHGDRDFQIFTSPDDLSRPVAKTNSKNGLVYAGFVERQGQVLLRYRPGDGKLKHELGFGGETELWVTTSNLEVPRPPVVLGVEKFDDRLEGPIDCEMFQEVLAIEESHTWPLPDDLRSFPKVESRFQLGSETLLVDGVLPLRVDSVLKEEDGSAQVEFTAFPNVSNPFEYSFGHRFRPRKVALETMPSVKRISLHIASCQAVDLFKEGLVFRGSFLGGTLFNLQIGISPYGFHGFRYSRLSYPNFRRNPDTGDPEFHFLVSEYGGGHGEVIVAVDEIYAESQGNLWDLGFPNDLVAYDMIFDRSVEESNSGTGFEMEITNDCRLFVHVPFPEAGGPGMVELESLALGPDYTKEEIALLKRTALPDFPRFAPVERDGWRSLWESEIGDVFVRHPGENNWGKLRTHFSPD